MVNSGVKRLILLAFLLVLSLSSRAQYFSIGNDPSSLKWRQIETENFKLLFPEKSIDNGQKIASIIAQYWKPVGASMQHTPRKYPLILHPYSSLSNGWTIWAPRRVELFPRPPILGGAEDYASHLLIHEMRHIVQMDLLNNGFTKIASYVLGDQAVAAVVGLHLPGWLSEGDAVLTETLLSHSGRGRQALFFQDSRALWLDKASYSYDKAMFGSYKDYVPNHYISGYQLTAMGRHLGGPYVWADAIKSMGKNPFRFSLLTKELKKAIGVNKVGLYDKTKNWFTNYYENQSLEEFNSPQLLPVSKSRKFSDYLKPQMLENGDILCLKNSFEQIQEFIRIDSSGKEQHIAYPGYVEYASFDSRNNTLVWAENNPDIRWENKSFSNIYAINLETGLRWQVSEKTRLYSPCLDPTAQKVAVLEYLPNGLNQLLILDVNSGERLMVLPSPENQVFQSPEWSAENELWLMSTGRSGKKIWSYNFADHKLSELIDLGYQEVLDLTILEDTLYLIGPHGSRNVVYSFDRETLHFHLASTHPYGLNYLSSRNGSLQLSVYQNDGYKPASIVPSNEGTIHKRLILDEPVTALIERAPLESPVDTYISNGLEDKPYSKMLHLFKVHSWAPVSLDLSGYQLKPGFMLLSQNELGTLAGSAAVEYNITQQRLEESVKLNYTGWFPKISIETRTYGDYEILTASRFDSTKVGVNYRMLQTNLMTTVPLNFSSGRWFKGINTSITGSYTSYKGEVESSSSSYKNNKLVLGIGSTAYIYQRSAKKDLFPKWGVIASLSTLGQANYFTEEGNTYVTGSVRAYLPGLFATHSTRLYAGSFFKNDWVFPDQSPLWLPRGLYKNFNQYQTSAKLDYAFPFAYPDWNLGSLLYVKRLKSNAWIDAALSRNPEVNRFMSVGLDITSDFYFLRINAEIDAGIRLLYDVMDSKPGYEFLFNFNIQ